MKYKAGLMLLLVALGHAQIAEWIHRYPGYGSSGARDIAVDNSGNVYVRLTIQAMFMLPAVVTMLVHQRIILPLNIVVQVTHFGCVTMMEEQTSTTRRMLSQ
jgi:hypothetical protein